MKRIASLSLLVFLSLSPRAFAHGTGSTLMGTVTAVSPSQISVRASDGDVVKVPVDEKTEFHRGSTVATASDVAVGMRIVVEVDEKSGAPAKSVRLPAANAPAPAEHSAPRGNEDGHGEQEHPAGEPH